jgi:LAO/AO transport system kinase
MPVDWQGLVHGACDFHKQSLARLVSVFEDTRPEASFLRQQILAALHARASGRRARIIGFTGTPGAGKSTLIAELCQQLLDSVPSLRIAVLAVDPSSHISGGSLLGDRTRMRLTRHQDRLFFRSQASNLELGGITHATWQATRLLRHFADLIVIETVGIGQNEIDIQRIADHTFLVMQPLAGDQIQFMKCGIMEIPDSFVINKCDEETLAKSSYYLLRTALKQARLVALDAGDDIRQAARDSIYLVSALRRTGITPLAERIMALPEGTDTRAKDIYYLEKVVQRDFGAFGVGVLKDLLLTQSPDMTFEQRQAAFRVKMSGMLKSHESD